MSAYAQQLRALHEAMLHKQPSAMLPLIKPARADACSPEMRLAVYADGYDVRLIDATLADYPALAHFMGHEPCRARIAAFVRATPSRHWDLNHYPVAFAAYLKQHDASDHAAHALCDLESAIADVFWAPESAPLTADALAGMSEDAFANQHFSLIAAAQLLVLNYAASDYLSAFRAGSAHNNIQKHTVYLLVVRRNNEVKREVLECAEYELLQALASGVAFGTAVSQVSDQERLTIRLPDYIARWLTHGFLRALTDQARP